MYNVRLSVARINAHRAARSVARTMPAQPLVPGVATLIAIDVLLFALVIIRILETRGG
jgi:hypothetical protein